VPTPRNRIKAGDVLELKAGDRFAYLQYIGKHPEYGDAVLVNPRLQERQTSISAELFDGGYTAFYPAAAAIAQGLAEVVSSLSPPDLPKRLRRAGRRTGRRIDTWIIEGGSGDVVKDELSADDLRLPIASIWNHELLVQRIAEGWSPVREGGGV
jgi:hypothetical protein